MAIVGAFALALGLAFGLGGRDTASEIIQSWDRRARSSRGKIEQSADLSADKVKEATSKKGG